MKNEILQKKEYRCICSGIFFYCFANALSETFGSVMLYKAGLSLGFIMLIFAIRYLITALITPLFVVLSNRLGIANCIFISNIFSIINTYFMLNSDSLYRNIIIFVVTMGCMGLLNPSPDALASKYVMNEHRGRFNSIYNISKIAGTVLASCLVAWGVISDKHSVLFIAIIISFLLQYFSIRRIDYRPERQPGVFRMSMKYILQKNDRLKVIFAFRTGHILERLFLPLYLYIALQDFAAFSTVIIISLLFQAITILLIGKFTDQNPKKSNHLVAVIRVIITAAYFILKNKMLISCNKTLSDNFEKVYETSIKTSMQNVIRNSKEGNELLASVGQMCLCFTETVILLILSLAAKYIGNGIFYVIFALSIFSTLVIDYELAKEIHD